MKRLLIAAAFATVFAAPAIAQDAEEQEEIEDTIVIFGPSGPRDAAMDAYARGDYETAEVEFNKNFQCYQREERQQEWAFDQASTAAIDAEIGEMSAANIGSDAQANTAPDYDGPAPQENIAARSCDLPAYQLYMKALSQLKLGKRDDAKETLYRVIEITNDERYFDAHFRIALLELLDGNIDKAQARRDYLQMIQRRCQRRGDRCEWRGELDETVALLETSFEQAEATG